MLPRALTLAAAWLRPRPVERGVEVARRDGLAPRVELPFALDIPVRSYLNQALPLSIVALDEGHRPALLQNFVQLFFPDDKQDYDRVLMLPALRAEEWARLGFLETREIDAHAPALARPERLLAALVEDLAGGGYVEAHIDEYWLPGRPCHGRVHSVHDNLLLGYDLERRSFRLAGYGRDYELSDAGFDDIAASFYGLPRGQLRRRALRLLRPRPGPRAALDVAAVARRLRDYVESRATLSPREMRAARLYWKARRFTGAWGLATYAAFEAYVARAARAQVALDLRATRTLWEHKDCMLRRLEHLEAEGRLPRGAGLAAGYASVERFARAARFAAFEYNACGFQRRHADAIAEALGAMRPPETDVLREAVERLEV